MMWVVDGDYRLHIAEKLSLAELILEKNRNQSCLPVMAVYHIGLCCHTGNKDCLSDS